MPDPNFNSNPRPNPVPNPDPNPHPNPNLNPDLEPSPNPTPNQAELLDAAEDLPLTLTLPLVRPSYWPLPRTYP